MMSAVALDLALAEASQHGDHHRAVVRDGGEDPVRLRRRSPPWSWRSRKRRTQSARSRRGRRRRGGRRQRAQARPLARGGQVAPDEGAPDDEARWSARPGACSPRAAAYRAHRSRSALRGLGSAGGVEDAAARTRSTRARAALLAGARLDELRQRLREQRPSPRPRRRWSRVTSARVRSTPRRGAPGRAASALRRVLGAGPAAFFVAPVAPVGRASDSRTPADFSPRPPTARRAHATSGVRPSRSSISPMAARTRATFR